VIYYNYYRIIRDERTAFLKRGNLVSGAQSQYIPARRESDVKSRFIKGLAILMSAAAMGGVLLPPGLSSAGDPINWSGAWQTTFGELVLRQQGNLVEGTYTYRGGRLRGEVKGNTLVGQWMEGKGETPEYVGDFEFVMVLPGRDRYVGRWGKGYGQPMKGLWVGKKMTR